MGFLNHDLDWLNETDWQLDYRSRLWQGKSLRNHFSDPTADVRDWDTEIDLDAKLDKDTDWLNETDFEAFSDSLLADAAFDCESDWPCWNRLWTSDQIGLKKLMLINSRNQTGWSKRIPEAKTLTGLLKPTIEPKILIG